MGITDSPRTMGLRGWSDVRGIGVVANRGVAGTKGVISVVDIGGTTISSNFMSKTSCGGS